MAELKSAKLASYNSQKIAKCIAISKRIQRDNGIKNIISFKDLVYKYLNDKTMHPVLVKYKFIFFALKFIKCSDGDDKSKALSYLQLFLQYTAFVSEVCSYGLQLLTTLLGSTQSEDIRHKVLRIMRSQILHKESLQKLSSDNSFMNAICDSLKNTELEKNQEYSIGIICLIALNGKYWKVLFDTRALLIMCSVGLSSKFPSVNKLTVTSIVKLIDNFKVNSNFCEQIIEGSENLLLFDNLVANDSSLAANDSSSPANDSSSAANDSSLAANDSSLAANDSSLTANDSSLAANDSSLAANDSSLAANDSSSAATLETLVLQVYVHIHKSHLTASSSIEYKRNTHILQLLIQNNFLQLLLKVLTKEPIGTLKYKELMEELCNICRLNHEQWQVYGHSKCPFYYEKLWVQMIEINGIFHLVTFLRHYKDDLPIVKLVLNSLVGLNMLHSAKIKVFDDLCTGKFVSILSALMDSAITHSLPDEYSIGVLSCKHKSQKLNKDRILSTTTKIEKINDKFDETCSNSQSNYFLDQFLPPNTTNNKTDLKKEANTIEKPIDTIDRKRSADILEPLHPTRKYHKSKETSSGLCDKSSSSFISHKSVQETPNSDKIHPSIENLNMNMMKDSFNEGSISTELKEPSNGIRIDDTVKRNDKKLTHSWKWILELCLINICQLSRVLPKKDNLCDIFLPKVILYLNRASTLHQSALVFIENMAKGVSCVQKLLDGPYVLNLSVDLWDICNQSSNSCSDCARLKKSIEKFFMTKGKLTPDALDKGVWKDMETSGVIFIPLVLKNFAELLMSRLQNNFRLNISKTFSHLEVYGTLEIKSRLYGSQDGNYKRHCLLALTQFVSCPKILFMWLFGHKGINYIFNAFDFASEESEETVRYATASFHSLMVNLKNAFCVKNEDFCLNCKSHIDDISTLALENKTRLLNLTSKKPSNLIISDCLLNSNDLECNLDIILSGNEIVKVNKQFLSAKNIVFNAMINGYFEEANRSCIKLTDVNPNAMKMILHYLYGCTCEAFFTKDLNAFEELVYLSQMYFVPELQILAMHFSASLISASAVYDFTSNRIFNLMPEFSALFLGELIIVDTLSSQDHYDWVSKFVHSKHYQFFKAKLLFIIKNSLTNMSSLCNCESVTTPRQLKA